MNETKTKQFDPTKPVQTRDGRKARIIPCSDIKLNLTGEIGFIAIVADCEEYASVHHIDGRSVSLIPCNDLINIPTKREGWVNVYPPRYGNSKEIAAHGAVYAAKEHADAMADEANESGIHRIACVRIEWEE